MLKILAVLGALVGACVVAVPVAFIVTIVMFPFWSWLEATYGIESVGHSGPDDWCFMVTYGVIAVLASFVAIRVVLAWRKAERAG